MKKEITDEKAFELLNRNKHIYPPLECPVEGKMSIVHMVLFRKRIHEIITTVPNGISDDNKLSVSILHSEVWPPKDTKKALKMILLKRMNEVKSFANFVASF